MSGRILSGALALAALVAPALGAQGGSIDVQCKAGTVSERITQDLCQKAIDVFTFMAPQLGTAIAGGNAVSGEHSTLSGPGRFSVGFRVNVLRARLPQLDGVTTAITGAVASDYDTEQQAVPVPTLDAAIGVFRGIPIGGVDALGFDALLNLAVLPSVTAGDVSVSLPSGRVKVGFGGRLSIVRESILAPGISLTWLRRDLPSVSVTGTPGSDEIHVDDFRVKTSAWRAVVGKNLGPVSLSAGFGQDSYETSALADVTVVRGGVTSTASQVVAVQDLERDNAFGSVALNLALLSLVAEYGRASGGKLATFNTFNGQRADDPRDFVSVGLRFRW